jgi:hypothetical protein
VPALIRLGKQSDKTAQGTALWLCVRQDHHAQVIVLRALTDEHTVCSRQRSVRFAD